MKRMGVTTAPELDLETDDLLNRIARSGDTVYPELLKAIIPNREVYIQYLKRHRLSDHPLALNILKQFDALAAGAEREKPKVRPAFAKGMTKTQFVRAMAEKLELTNKQ